jgi:ABC-2 type transport system permease protein
MASVATAARGSSLLTSSVVIAKQRLFKVVRTPALFWTYTMQGVLFLVIFRYIFGGAIAAGELGYTDFVIPGILATGLIWQGMGGAVGVTEDVAQGLFDRLRSLPIPRSAVLAGRALADTAMQMWSLMVMAVVSFLVGFRVHDGLNNALIAAALIIVFVFAFEWVFITMGLYSGNPQAAQGMSMILVPFTFVSSAYVPVESMPGWLQAVAENQPVTFMTDAVRSLTGGATAEAMLGHDASYFVFRSLVWSAVIVVLFGTIGILRYRRG